MVLYSCIYPIIPYLVDIGIANWLQLYIVEFFARTTHSITEVGEFLILCLPVLSKGPKVTRV